MDQQNRGLARSLSFNSKWKLFWLASFDFLQSLVEEVLGLLDGERSSPRGGDSKLY